MNGGRKMNRGVGRRCLPLIIMKNRSRRAALGSTVINDLFNFPAHRPNYAGAPREAPPSLGKQGDLCNALDRGREEGSGETLSCFPKTLGPGGRACRCCRSDPRAGQDTGPGKDSAHLWRGWRWAQLSVLKLSCKEIESFSYQVN